MTAAYDRARLVELFGNDAAALADIEREFLDTVCAAEREIAGTDDLLAIARAAHRLKGAAGMVGAADLRALAESIEGAAKAENLSSIHHLRDVLASEARRLVHQLN